MILIPPFRSFKHATIEPLIIEKDKLDELKTKLTNPNLASVSKHNYMRGVTGTCHSCGQLPTKIVKYRRYGMVIIEKFCDGCLERMQLV